MSDVFVTFRHLEATPALKAYAEEKAAKINKYFGGLNEVNVVLSLEKHRYTAEITLKAGRTTVNAREETSDMYSAIDLVVDKINRQIKKYKDKMKDHKASPAERKIAGRYNIVSSSSIGNDKEPEIIKTEHLLAKPMSLEEAVMPANFVGSLNNAGAEVVDPANGIISMDGVHFKTADTEMAKRRQGDKIHISIRPERFSFAAEPLKDNVVDCTIENITFLGSVVRIQVKIGTTKFNMETFNNPFLELPAIGAKEKVMCSKEAVLVLESA